MSFPIVGTDIREAKWQEIARCVHGLGFTEKQERDAIRASLSDEEIFENGFYLALNLATQEIQRLKRAEKSLQ